MTSNATKTGNSLLKDREEKAVRDTIAEKLYDLIKDNKTTSDAVAKKTGIAKGTISNYLNAKTSPKAFELKKLADFFGVTCDELIRGVQAENVKIYEKTGLSDAAIENISDIYVNDLCHNMLIKVLEHKELSGILYDMHTVKYAKIRAHVENDSERRPTRGDGGFGILLTYNEYMKFCEQRLRDDFYEFAMTIITDNTMKKDIEEAEYISRILKESNPNGEIWNTLHDGYNIIRNGETLKPSEEGKEGDYIIPFTNLKDNK